MKDNFSKQAEDYAKYRPGYPAALFEFIMQRVTSRERAWDCATGNGQAAVMIARYFSQVEATDISAKQIQQATPANNITYSIQPADKTNFPDNHFDLITVAQALHWFPFDPFFTEVKRVAKPGAHIAAWMYDLPTVSRDIDEMLKAYYSETLNGYWDAERKHVDSHYRDILWPFEEIICPLFYTEYDWDIDSFQGYLRTWSALQHFIEKNAYSPLDGLMKAMRPSWVKEKMTVRFPVYLRMGKILK